MNRRHDRIAFLLIVGAAAAQSACVTQAPTIAHVHVGHALTAATDTPNRQGYFILAEQQGRDIHALARSAVETGQARERIQATLAAVDEQVNGAAPDAFGRLIQETVNHIRFAAESRDASTNLKSSAGLFAEHAEGILYRNGLIRFYVKDALSSTSEADVQQLAAAVLGLTASNLHGEDLDRNDRIGDSAREYGVEQLRRELDAMIAREDPPYTTVDRWYLFNLIRLPSGEWMFRRGSADTGSAY